MTISNMHTILVFKIYYFHHSYGNARARYIHSNLPETNIQASLVLKIIMKKSSQIFFQDDYFTKSQYQFGMKLKNKKSVST